MPDVICTRCGNSANGYWREDAPAKPLRPRLLCQPCGLAINARGGGFTWHAGEADHDGRPTAADVTVGSSTTSRSPAPGAAPLPPGEAALELISAFAVKRAGELRAYVQRAGGSSERVLARSEAETFDQVVKLVAIVRGDADLRRRVTELLGRD